MVVARIEVIPENVPFQKEELRSLGDETPSENTDAAATPSEQQTEQEEISRKRKKSSVDTEQSNQDKPYQKKERKKKARCWPYLDTIAENNVKIAAVCKLCQTRMKIGTTGCTTTFNRHVDKCLILLGRTQQTQLQFQPSDDKSPEVTLVNFKYDHSEMIKVISHYILVNELPFRYAESFMFDVV
ncbi:hypothetical protein POM88_016223 [Heracleum sosnowskyi]|uniref:BED-type domain-containing protein n=1 Tax=Heracleum sosnowskyi TaxID=360622 RepID=A0AAD8IQ62_9APIA|nr:hypothetical protein POM88_016223 [Heracleum sosnowskyi]